MKYLFASALACMLAITMAAGHDSWDTSQPMAGAYGMSSSSINNNLILQQVMRMMYEMNGKLDGGKDDHDDKGDGGMDGNSALLNVLMGYILKGNNDGGGMGRGGMGRGGMEGMMAPGMIAQIAEQVEQYMKHKEIKAHFQNSVDGLCMFVKAMASRRHAGGPADGHADGQADGPANRTDGAMDDMDDMDDMEDMKDMDDMDFDSMREMMEKASKMDSEERMEMLMNLDDAEFIGHFYEVAALACRSSWEFIESEEGGKRPDGDGYPRPESEEEDESKGEDGEPEGEDGKPDDDDDDDKPDEDDKPEDDKPEDDKPEDDKPEDDKPEDGEDGKEGSTERPAAK